MAVRKRNRRAGRGSGGRFRHVIELTPTGDAWRLGVLVVAAFVFSLTFGFYLGYRQEVTGVPTGPGWATLQIATLVLVTALFLLLTWTAMFRSSARQLREWSLYQQEPRTFRERLALAMVGKRVFGGRTGFVTLVSYSAFGLMYAVFLLPSFRATIEPGGSAWTNVLSAFGVLVFWATLHTAFAFNYAYLFYRPNGSDGLEFPAQKKPVATDFLYFAFTVATSFAVSDVSVTSARVRKAVLAHSVLGFFYNTVVLALVVNIVISSAS